MSQRVSCFILVFLFVSCYSNRGPQQRQTRLLQKGKIKEDTSYVYSLPYETGASHLLIQGYYSAFSHKKRAALDFRMKRGTPVLAAREGVVLRLKENGTRGGLHKKYRPQGNYVIIEHADKTRAGYWHLQQNGVLVNVGDSISKGQLIGLSGKTGYTALPHLHFLVWTNPRGQWQQVPTRFMTQDGPRYLKPLRKYKK
ncbi:MAG TPA: M23 family metallopeptidase [Ferruginibacter sp.]|nr:M23 family metallopeptidase [Ferruginibacter sp.]